MMILDLSRSQTFQNIFKIINRGNCDYGRLGQNNFDHQLTPKKVEALAGKIIVDVACGQVCIYAVTSTGSIFALGCVSAVHGDDIVPLPRLLQDLSSKGVVSVSSCSCISACVTKAGELLTWGDGYEGCLGYGDERSTQMHWLV
jgi:alpha-tubulin suppressor-like RCC1 family protein